MPKPSDMSIKDVTCRFDPIAYRTPLKYGGRETLQTLLVTVDLTAESRDGKHRAAGSGSMPLGNVWSWPSSVMTTEQTTAAAKVLTEETVELGSMCTETAHPLDLVIHLEGEYFHLAQTVAKRQNLPEGYPALAVAFAGSAFDAALHDAFGRLHHVSSFDTLAKKFMSHDLSEYLGKPFAGEYLDQYTQRAPTPKLAIYHLVGNNDPLTPADVVTAVKDGLPECLQEWIRAEGLTHFKLKLSADMAANLARIQAVHQVVLSTNAAAAKEIRYVLDFNELAPSAAAVVDLLAQLKSKTPAAFSAVAYLEQPLSRDLAAHPLSVSEIAAVRPVIADESVIDADGLELARSLGYSGVALKTCKGHSESLLLAAFAQKHGMMMCVQDLTCPGFSFLHSASFAARLPGVTAVEGNARQYCPLANRQAAKFYPGLFKASGGVIDTSVLSGEGLGF